MEVTLGAKVLSPPTFFRGTHGVHETFDAVCNDGSAFDGAHFAVVDNVDIAPRIAVRSGDDIEVHGEWVKDAGRPPIVHWTHRDPHGRHEDGYIKWGGRVYA